MNKNIQMNMSFLKTLSSTLIGVSFAATMFAQSAFEGVITYNTTNASIDEKATVKWFHKNGQNLMEFQSKVGGQSMSYAMIMDSNSETVVLKTEQGSQELSGIEPEEIYTSASFIRKAKTKEGSYDCEMLMFKSNGNDLTYWVTSDINLPYQALPKLMRNNMPSMSGISEGFPLKMELRDSNGNLLRSHEVTSIEQTKVDESKFKR